MPRVAELFNLELWRKKSGMLVVRWRRCQNEGEGDCRVEFTSAGAVVHTIVLDEEQKCSDEFNLPAGRYVAVLWHGSARDTDQDASWTADDHAALNLDDLLDGDVEGTGCPGHSTEAFTIE